jgi:uncharacterized SAM-binding protein YcdF (DUF218 family)
MLVAGLCTWAAGLLSFIAAIPAQVADPMSTTDAIVVLTGGSERLTTGIKLLRQDLAERVLVTGVGPQVDAGKLLRLAGSGDSALVRRVDTGYAARNTAGNAAETAAWMRERGYRTLRLVTGSYHMPRSLLEFRFALPGAQVIPHPVFPDQVQPTAWWYRPGTAALIIGEYNKYLMAAFTHHVTVALPRAAS